MEAEYVAGFAAIQEGVRLRRFLQEFGTVARAEEPVAIYCDSQAAIAYSNDPKYHEKTKHRYKISFCLPYNCAKGGDPETFLLVAWLLIF